MHLERRKRKLQQEKSKAVVLSQRKSITISLHSICKENLHIAEWCYITLQKCKEVLLQIQKGLRRLRVESDSMQTSSLKIKAAFKL